MTSRPTPDPTLERGFVASLRWLVAEGDARGVHRLAVELRALREALTTLDETRSARDAETERATELDREMQDALAVLSDATQDDAQTLSLVDRLRHLREILSRDLASRRALMQERDSWRAMCEFQTVTRAMVHAMLEESERGREALEAQVGTMLERLSVLDVVHEETVHELTVQRRAASDASTELAQLEATASLLREHVVRLDRDRHLLQQVRERFRTIERERDIAAADARKASTELSALRSQLNQWSGTVDRALDELSRAAAQRNVAWSRSTGDTRGAGPLDARSGRADDLM